MNSNGMEMNFQSGTPAQNGAYVCFVKGPGSGVALEMAYLAGTGWLGMDDGTYTELGRLKPGCKVLCWARKPDPSSERKYIVEHRLAGEAKDAMDKFCSEVNKAAAGSLHVLIHACAHALVTTDGSEPVLRIVEST